NLRAYARHLWRDYLGLGTAAAAAGAAVLWARDPVGGFGLLLAYVLSGPVFLFLANLPPNPHALAIVEPHYLLSDLLLAVWAARGLGELRRRPVGAWAALLLGVVPVIRPFTSSRRWNLLGYDYARNVFASIPENAVLVAKKDVPLFTLWYAQR